MTAAYPAAIASLTRIPDNDAPGADGSPTDAKVIVDRLSGEVEATQVELGTDPSGAAATVAERLDALDTTVAGKSDTGHAHGAAGYATVQEEGAALTARTVLNFAGYGATAADNVGAGKTDVTVPGPFPDPSAGGRYLASPLVGAAANTALNRLYLLPLVTPWPAGRYITQVFVQPATTVGGGVTIKAALYSSAGALSKIGADITVLAAGSTTAGVLKVANVASGSRPQFDSTKSLHFLGIVVQGAGALSCGFPHQLEQLSPTPNGALPAAFGYYEDGITGALPATSYAPYLSQSVTNLPFHLAGVGTSA